MKRTLLWLFAFVACVGVEAKFFGLGAALVLALFAVMDAVWMGGELYDTGRRDGAAAARAALERLPTDFGCLPPGTKVTIRNKHWYMGADGPEEV